MLWLLGLLVALLEVTMERIGFVMRQQPGAEAEYRRRHAAVWPEMLGELKMERQRGASS